MISINRTIGIIILVGILFVSACKTQKDLNNYVYFNQPGDTTLSKRVQDYEPTIQKGDRLSVLVTALDPASVAPYNIGASVSGATASATTPASGYLVDT